MRFITEAYALLPTLNLSKTKRSPTRYTTPRPLAGIHTSNDKYCKITNVASTMMENSSVAIVEEPAPLVSERLHRRSYFYWVTRGRQWTATCNTNRAAVPPGTTASTACSALSLAADVVIFHAGHSVAARKHWHTRETISTARQRVTRETRQGTNVCATS